MNRVMQSLRRSVTADWVHHTVAILDWNKLVDLAGLDPT
ncbi:hypothetical protein P9272_29875 [Mesorhizobium sp. WSM4976]|nr:hypothetical protein [Mesorhizobium sp. WSM4976]MDG4897752.1 hypothetical protein [Mesorhizobium sp. WSM4976]